MSLNGQISALASATFKKSIMQECCFQFRLSRRRFTKEIDAINSYLKTSKTRLYKLPATRFGRKNLKTFPKTEFMNLFKISKNNEKMALMEIGGK